MIGPWTGGTPATITELFDFYHQYVKVLYSYVQTQDKLPQETLFEINAAFDHLSRHWTMGETEQEAVARAFGHLRRSCFDIFKLKVKETREQYDALCKIDTTGVDNGDFNREMHIAFNGIRDAATKARQLEGRTKQSPGVPAFEAWEQVFQSCLGFESRFHLHPRLKWAKRRRLFGAVKHQLSGIAIIMMINIVFRVASDAADPPRPLYAATGLVCIASVLWHMWDWGYFRTRFHRAMSWLRQLS